MGPEACLGWELFKSTGGWQQELLTVASEGLHQPNLLELLNYHCNDQLDFLDFTLCLLMARA
eukprot:2365864-Prorocentrum_lima.AAC.1